ncbi:MAG: YgiT-type zinc finger protein [Myxococcales bacterium]|jgi:YgiT-type zinc finger domain-containing protein
MAEVQCPACGSHEVVTSKTSQTYTPPYGETTVVCVRLDECQTCGESGDFAGTNSQIVREAMEKADRESIGAILDSLAEAGVSAAYIERALSLPARTVARWKAGGSSASGLALLRLVRTFPWLLEVAAAGYAERKAKRAVVMAAAAEIEEAAAVFDKPSATDASPSAAGNGVGRPIE